MTSGLFHVKTSLLACPKTLQKEFRRPKRETIKALVIRFKKDPELLQLAPELRCTSLNRLTKRVEQLQRGLD